MKSLVSIAAALLLATSACSDLSTNPSANLSGSYQLRTLNNSTLPATLFYNSASDHVEILSGRIDINSDGSYTDLTTVQDTYNGSTTVYDDNTSGYWTLSGNTLTLQDTYNGKVTSAYAANNQLTFNSVSGYAVTAVYSK